MNIRRIGVFVVVTALLIAMVVWFGGEYKDETRIFLRALARLL